MQRYKAVLFDLDGTLLDSAVHFHSILNKQALELGTAEVDFETVRQWASNGAAVMIENCLGITADAENFQQLNTQFLELYDQEVHTSCPLFEEIESLLLQLKSKDIPIAIITNKGRRFYQHIEPQLEQIIPVKVGITRDDVTEIKPHPEGLLNSAKQLNITPEECLYVGDHKRDIDAAINAHMPSAAACWGYIHKEDNPTQWNANHLLKTPTELLNLI
ncbi:HAD-IA family hydrolase [Litoribacillus peritrichatus]|uniref:HAD family hydrolase n=1 Tax=Litoribacillus peritrichatus TaxID=718191 RepID=A0ABP7M8Y2_9GAMM